MTIFVDGLFVVSNQYYPVHTCSGVVSKRLCICTVLSHPDDTVSSIAPLSLLDALRSHNWTIDFHQQVRV